MPHIGISFFVRMSNSMEQGGERPSIINRIATEHPRSATIAVTVALSALSLIIIEAARDGGERHPAAQTKNEQTLILDKAARSSVAFETPVTGPDGKVRMVPAILTLGDNGQVVITKHETPPATGTTIADNAR